MTRPVVAGATETLYDGLGPALRQGDDAQWVMLKLLDVPGSRLQPVDDLVRDRPGSPGWAVAADLDRTAFLPWLLQWVGVVHRPELTDTENRARGRNRPESRRGTVAYIRAIAEEFLSGDRRVEVDERYLGASRDVRVRIYGQEIAAGVTEARIEAALNAAIPWTFTLVFEVAAGWTFQQLADQRPGATLADLAAEFDTLADIGYHESEV